MRFDAQRIRRSMDSRLSSLDTDQTRRMRIRKMIYEAEEPVMRRKFTTSAVLAIVLAMLLVGTAFAVGINLFDYFGKNNDRFKEIAPQTELAHAGVAEIETEEVGLTRISFNSAYYDGQSLLIGYTIENSECTEAFVPTAEQLAKMEKREKDGEMYWRGFDGWGDWIPEGFEQAVAEGTPLGTVKYSIYAHDTFEANGVELSSSMGLEEDKLDSQYRLVEFENPLPKVVQNLDSVEIRMGIAMSTVYTWFDGEELYQSWEQRELGELTTVANRADAQTKVYTGDGSYNGIPVHLRAEVSAVHATLTISAEGDAFPQFEDSDKWYDVCLVGDQGEWFRTRVVDNRTHALNVKHEGTGKLPAELSAYIVVCDESSAWTFAERMEAAEPILLTPQDEI